eukprot:165054_1
MNTEEEENKFGTHMQEITDKNHCNRIDFIPPRESDYIDCQNNKTHNLKDCNLVKRIMHLLTFRQQHQKNAQIYEYLSSMKNYDVATFMEDWYQVKNNHLRDDEGIDWIKHNANIQCDNINGCEYIDRHQRKRGNETYSNMKQTEIDYKNIILTDQFDSIHTFIFHSISSRNKQINSTIIVLGDDDQVDDMKHEENPKVEDNHKFISADKLQSISQCNMQQVLWIINHEIFDKLKQKDRDRLLEHKMSILQHMNECKYDGNKLQQTKRKEFINKIATHLQNNKLKPSLGALYKVIMEYPSKLFENDNNTKENIWFTKPESIQQCDVNQIKFIVNHVIVNNVDKLNGYKLKIIQYVQQRQINGDKLYEMKRKDFINEMVLHLDNNKKLKAQLGKLRKYIMECDLSIFTGIKPEEKTVAPANIKSNNKFETKMVHNKETNSYYSFGTQFRYTKNLQHHPLYVESKYPTLKKEIYEYFKEENEASDAYILQEHQLTVIKQFDSNTQENVFDSNTQSFLLSVIMKNETVNDTYVLWHDNEIESEYKYDPDAASSLLQIEKESVKHFNEIVSILCRSLKKKKKK